MKQDLVKTSKLLSYVLRHKPESINIELDTHGWVLISTLLDALERNGEGITREILEEIVRSNEKKRFAFSEDGLKIRANQGHSVQIDLALEPGVPPQVLFHGTATKFLKSIFQTGLSKGRRHQVHLSKDLDTARQVGRRHGTPVVLEVASGLMHQRGEKFYLSENGVWLTDRVEPQYLKLKG